MYSVEVNNLTVKFDGFTAVDNISFTVNEGEIFGFLGANGAGKTTTIRVLCGLLLPTHGQISVGGVTLTNRPSRLGMWGFKRSHADQIKSKVGYMSQRFTLYDDMTIEENLLFSGSLRKIPTRKLRHRIKELFDFIGFDHPTWENVKDLSGGIKQQVSLVASLLHDPEIVFLDEPTAGVTPASRARFWDLIRKLSKEGKTVFVTTHYMDEAEECQQLALMRTGQIIAMDSPGALKRKTFSEPLYELSSNEKVFKSEIIASMMAEPAVLSFQPYGSRYHASFKDEKAAASFANRYKHYLVMKRIQPSLEDVFIKLVEGEGAGRTKLGRGASGGRS